MNKVILYLLLFSYTTTLLKPVLPAMTDAVAHIFWYSRHAATVHVEKGKMHLHFETMRAVDKKENDKNNPTEKTGLFNGEHFPVSALYNFTISVTQEKKYSLYLDVFSANYPSFPFRPPECI